MLHYFQELSAPWEKLTALFEDIFEAEDALISDPDLRDLSSDLFSHLAFGSSRPLLHSTVIQKVTKYVGQVSRPSKRFRSSVYDGTTRSGGTPRTQGRMTEIDITMLSRILKVLERSVRAGEDLDPISNVAIDRERLPDSRAKSTCVSKTTPKSGGGRSKLSSSKPSDSVESDNIEDPSPLELTEVDLVNLTRALDIARDSILAADCCIAILGSDRLNKQVGNIVLVLFLIHIPCF